jgi:hypothetical protein
MGAASRLRRPVIDPQAVRFRPATDLTPQAIAVITEQVRVRMLRWFARSGLIEPGGCPRDAWLGEQWVLLGCVSVSALLVGKTHGRGA